MIEQSKPSLCVHCLMHVPFEGPDAIQDWAIQRGHTFQITSLHQAEPLPATADFDLLVVMGGPMSVQDEAQYPWLKDEKSLVRRCLQEGRFVLGVCLGSQILAECLGATVRRNRYKEIGWMPVRCSAGAGTLLEGFPPEMVVLHWHGETYDLPPGATLLASSEACAVQAFEHPSALALQFHFEVSAAGLDSLIAHCRHEIGTGPYEQPPETIREGERIHGEQARRHLFQLLDRIAARIMPAPGAGTIRAVVDGSSPAG